jgi:exodeoxyribonuclease-3
LFTRITPKHIEYGCGHEDYDFEGRIIRADFDRVSVMSTYFPSGTTGDVRQDFKYRFLEDFQSYSDKLLIEKPNLVVCGDYNICHRAIDIHNPKSNANSSGFLPEEREWMENFINSGYIDSFRHLNPDPHHYSWWSYRAGARAKNLGWRIDYNMVSKPLAEQIKSSSIMPDAVHSDHCPVLLELAI